MEGKSSRKSYTGLGIENENRSLKKRLLDLEERVESLEKE
jgi:hypothetical protein